MIDLYIIDGYNFIFNYYHPEGVSKEKLAYFRDKLVRDLTQYSNFKGFRTILVFDAKNSVRKSGTTGATGDIEVIYSRGDETADSIIEKLVHSNEKYERIFVVTSDYMQQKVVFKQNIYRKSIREFAIELQDFKKELEKEIENLKRESEKSFYIIEKRLDKKTRGILDGIRKDSIEK